MRASGSSTSSVASSGYQQSLGGTGLHINDGVVGRDGTGRAGGTGVERTRRAMLEIPPKGKDEHDWRTKAYSPSASAPHPGDAEGEPFKSNAHFHGEAGREAEQQGGGGGGDGGGGAGGGRGAESVSFRQIDEENGEGLPTGRCLTLLIQSTWGDEKEVSLSGADILEQT